MFEVNYKITGKYLTDAETQEEIREYLEEQLRWAGFDSASMNVEIKSITPPTPDAVLDACGEIIVYLPAKNVFVTIEEGSGENLSDDDRRAGYHEYVNWDYYSIDGDQIDGGMLLLPRPFRDMYPKTQAGSLIRDILEEIFEDRFLEYVILQKG